MKFICTRKCFFHGRSIKPDTIVDIPESEAKLDIVKSSFKPLGKPAAVPEKDTKPPSKQPADDSGKKTPPPIDGDIKVDGSNDELSVEELRRRLDAWGIVYAHNAGKKRLTELYLQQLNQTSEVPGGEE